ncbi:hypothetical protein [Alkalibacillus silvisoli]|uniref:Transposase n=1 Tax=Alkalibacillus silvisoli TaxID=392823 RepID=A0ABN0ZZX3_9BACI
MNRSLSSISRELNHNSKNNENKLEITQEQYDQCRLNCGCILKWSHDLADSINEKIELTWSPEQITYVELQESVGFKTIYRWTYNGWLISNNLQVLRQKGKRKKPRETRGRFNIWCR